MPVQFSMMGRLRQRRYTCTSLLSCRRNCRHAMTTMLLVTSVTYAGPSTAPQTRRLSRTPLIARLDNINGRRSRRWSSRGSGDNGVLTTQQRRRSSSDADDGNDAGGGGDADRDASADDASVRRASVRLAITNVFASATPAAAAPGLAGGFWELAGCAVAVGAVGAAAVEGLGGRLSCPAAFVAPLPPPPPPPPRDDADLKLNFGFGASTARIRSYFSDSALTP